MFLLKRLRELCRNLETIVKNNIWIQITCLRPFQITPQPSASVIRLLAKGALFFVCLFVCLKLWSLQMSQEQTAQIIKGSAFRADTFHGTLLNHTQASVILHSLYSQTLEYWKHYNNRSLKFLTMLNTTFIYSLLLLGIKLTSSHAWGQNTTAELHHSPYRHMWNLGFVLMLCAAGDHFTPSGLTSISLCHF